MIVKQDENKIYFQNKYCHAKIEVDNQLAEICMIQVEPIYRNQGYAKKLMSYLMSFIKARYPNTRKIILSPLPLDRNGLQLKALRIFYQKYGFKDARLKPQDKPYMMEA